MGRKSKGPYLYGRLAGPPALGWGGMSRHLDLLCKQLDIILVNIAGNLRMSLRYLRITLNFVIKKFSALFLSAPVCTKTFSTKSHVRHIFPLKQRL